MEEYFDPKTGLMVVVERDEEEFFVASCPEWEGCHAQGTSLAEALKNIGEVIDAFAAMMAEDYAETLDRVTCFPRSRKRSLDPSLTYLPELIAIPPSGSLPAHR